MSMACRVGEPNLAKAGNTVLRLRKHATDVGHTQLQ